jgi:K+-transporting ATPase ATPase C chain
MRSSCSTLLSAFAMTLLTLLLTGVLYPLGMTGLCALLFPQKSHGSLLSDERGRLIGSALIGQRMSSAAYFQPRPSAASKAGYDALASAGSNLGPTSQSLRQRVIAEAERLRKENPDASANIPAELVTASASGLDPHLSPQAALWQVARVARARGLAEERIRRVVVDYIEDRDWFVLGEQRVNVLLLNLALDRQFGRPDSSGP